MLIIMKSSIMEKLESLHKRYEEIESMLSDCEIIADQNRFRELSQEYLKLSDINNCFVQWKKCEEDIKSTQCLLLDNELHEIAKQELELIIIRKQDLEKKNKNFIITL